MTQSTELKPLPPMTRLTKPFWDGCREGELRIQFCNICDLPWFPPAEACPRCLQDDWEWRTHFSGHAAQSGPGYSMWQKYFPGWEPDEYPIHGRPDSSSKRDRTCTRTLVEHRSGQRFVSDLAVEVTFEQVSKSISLPWFKPIE